MLNKVKKTVKKSVTRLRVREIGISSVSLISLSLSLIWRSLSLFKEDTSRRKIP